MQKRVISIILAVSLMFSLAAVTGITASAETLTSGDFEYELLDDGTVEITDYRGSEETLEIPSEFDGKSVTSIGYGAFESCKTIKNVTIPNSITYISDCAFAYCTSLANVTIPNSVTEIFGMAFLGCESLTKVTIPDSVTKIYSGAFENTALYNNKSNWENGVLYIDTYLIQANEDEISGDYNIKFGTKIIADCAFSDCTSLTSVTIPSSATHIGFSAFAYCTSLTNVTIPDSVTSIGDWAFDYCESLTNVTIPDSVISIGAGAFGFCGEFPVPNFHINCYKGTSGEQYAIDYHIDYTLLDDEPEPSITIENDSELGSVEKTVNEDGTVTLNAKVSGSAQFSKWNISGDYEIISGDLTSQTITLSLKSGNVTVSPVFENVSEPSTVTYGDANDDGNINMLDVLLIRKYIAKQPVTPNLDASDVTCDGNVNMLDVLLIRKYIAKQPVTLGPQK